MCLCALTLSNIGCKPPLGDPDTVPQCEFSRTKEITFTDFGLRLPYIQSANVAFNNAFNVGGIIYNLNTVLDTKGDYRYPNSNAQVIGNIKVDGACKGEKPFYYKKNNPNVLNNSVIVPAPEIDEFGGEVSITVATDSFREQGSANKMGFYVRWDVRAHDPDHFVNGNILGEKVGFNWDDDATILFVNDEPIYNGGGYDPIGGQQL